MLRPGRILAVPFTGSVPSGNLRSLILILILILIQTLPPC